MQRISVSSETEYRSVFRRCDFEPPISTHGEIRATRTVCPREYFKLLPKCKREFTLPRASGNSRYALITCRKAPPRYVSHSRVLITYVRVRYTSILVCTSTRILLEFRTIGQPWFTLAQHTRARKLARQCIYTYIYMRWRLHCAFAGPRVHNQAAISRSRGNAEHEIPQERMPDIRRRRFDSISFVNCSGLYPTPPPSLLSHAPSRVNTGWILQLASSQIRPPGRPFSTRLSRFRTGDNFNAKIPTRLRNTPSLI